MPDIDPQLVLVARTRLGMSQTKLAKSLRRSQAYVSKLEAGLVTPDEETLVALAVALDVPVRYFEVKAQIYPQTLSFHRSKKTTQAELGRLWAEMNMIRIMLHRLLASVELEAQNELPTLELDEVGTPMDAARYVRSALGLAPGPVRNLVQVVERAGVYVCGYDFRTSVVDGVSHVASGGLPPLVFLNTKAPTDRMRWSLAHELGHLVLHRYPTPTMEEEADRFASEFLMPALDIKPLLRRRLDLGVVGTLKQVWGCSMQSIYRRAKDLETISPRQYKRAMISMAPMRKNEPHTLPPEPVDALPELWRFHLDELDYSPPELLRTLPISAELVSLTTGYRPLHLVA